ncbi:helix-turn-helix domain-containing protein [Microbacterium sp. 179-I 3D4 NHS]|uniref:helix-turn-helix domain-containing protein n=1 Tax=Microbacterium sp. 179-I 3D4 NHS TaxID=3142381 RepID=UPI00399F01E2
MDSLLEGIIRRVIREEIAAVLGEQPFRLALTIPEAATAVGYSVETIRKQIRDNYLVPSYANSKPVIPVEELQRWLRSLPDEPL